jgi:molecular chaperone GrpE
MTARNIRPEEIERELPVAEEDGFTESQPRGGEQVSTAVAPSELEKVRAERDGLVDRLARLQAEFENYRKRNQREQAEFREYAVSEAVRSLLPALDSLDLALKNATAEHSDLREGIELTRKQLFDALSRLGLNEVPSIGKAFDPQLHQAIEMVDTTEAPDHQVLQELQRGYTLKGRLLRPAMVRVARNPHQ